MATINRAFEAAVLRYEGGARALAKASGVHESTISRIKHRRHQPTQPIVRTLCDELQKPSGACGLPGKYVPPKRTGCSVRGEGRK